jgi:hypothetical protein
MAGFIVFKTLDRFLAFAGGDEEGRRCKSVAGPPP